MKRTIQSYILVENALILIDILAQQTLNKLIAHKKHIRPVSSKYKNPQKRRRTNSFMEANDSKRDTILVEEDKEIERTLL